MIKIDVPYHGPKLNLKAGDLVEFTGTIYCGRDMVLPKVVEAAENGTLSQHDIDMEGAVIFHTAVSCRRASPQPPAASQRFRVPLFLCPDMARCSILAKAWFPRRPWTA